MDYEKKYKEALENAKHYHKEMGYSDEDIIRDYIIWPEEQGEQIDFANKEYWRGYHEGKLEILDKYADLEKRSKQKLVEKYNITGIGSKNAQGKLGEMIKNLKSADNVEPKFKVGDWIYHEISGNAFHINRIENHTYISDEGAIISFGRQNDWRPWTIQDAKDGDVLAVESVIDCPSSFIAIYKEHGLNFFNSHCFISLDGKFNEGTTGHSTSLIRPATKEQRDTLMKAMTDAGYSFDFEKKELREIKQKPAEWSEEDKKMFVNIKACLRNANKDYSREIDWLKSLKPHSNITDEELVKAKKDAYSDALNKIEYHSGDPTFDDGWSAAIWYLKKRNIIPQKQWKPTEEQMNALNSIILKGGLSYVNQSNELISLYKELKKL